METVKESYSGRGGGLGWIGKEVLVERETQLEKETEILEYI